MAVAAIFLAPTAGLTVAAKKRAENRRRQAAANDFSKKYPLSDDAATMQSYIAQATTEVKNLNAQPATTAGAKRVKKRNVEMLNKWILVMKDHSKDLKAGISVATTQVAPVPQVADMGTAAPLPAPASAVMPDVLPPAPAAEGEPAVEGAAPKKGTNWLLIGGAVVGVILLVNLLKKR